jgi:hypothetical protein
VTQVEVHTAETGAAWVNASGLETYDLTDTVNKVARELASWVNTTRGASKPSIFNRSAYVAPDNPYVLMATAKNAVDHDDVVSGTCDVTEGLMLQGLKWEADEADDADFFNQIARDLDLDEFARAWHREDFTYSQAVIGMWWGRREYTSRQKTPTGKKSKKTKIIYCPIALTFLDPSKVVPLQPGPFGQDRLAWRASDEEYAMSTAVQDGTLVTQDAVYDAFTTGPLNGLSKSEQSYLQSIGVDPKRLVGLNPDLVFRICRTKASYERWPTVRLKSVFALLDLKQQLMEADRVTLVGSANYLLLVRQGSKEEPARQEEIDNLNENFQVVAKLPVIVGDHRLQIDIITPQQEWTLAPSKYDTIDQRIVARTLAALSIGNGQNAENSVTLARGIGRQLETRRHMFKRTLEQRIARVVVEHPANEGIFKGEPNLAFIPRNVALDTDAEVARAVLTLRTQKELSRETTLEHFGFDQSVEAMRREFEEDSGLDDLFGTIVPFSSPDQGGTPPQVSGGQGGRPPGGGESPKSVQGQTKKRNQRGQPST